MSEQQPKEANAYLDRLLTVCKSKTFLGREFLTWLWFQAGPNETPFEITAPSGEKQALIYGLTIELFLSRLVQKLTFTH